eukprot:scpid51096/ scgid25209/ 
MTGDEHGLWAHYTLFSTSQSRFLLVCSANNGKDFTSTMKHRRDCTKQDPFIAGDNAAPPMTLGYFSTHSMKIYSSSDSSHPPCRNIIRHGFTSASSEVVKFKNFIIYMYMPIVPEVKKKRR